MENGVVSISRGSHGLITIRIRTPREPTGSGWNETKAELTPMDFALALTGWSDVEGQVTRRELVVKPRKKRDV